MSKRQEYLDRLSDEDRKNLTDALNTWKAAGNPNPLIPIGEDLTGDGIADSWGLTVRGVLTVKPGVALGSTVYESTGDDVVEGAVDDDVVADD